MGEPCIVDSTDFNRIHGFGTNLPVASTSVLPNQRGSLCSLKNTLAAGATTGWYWNLSSAQSTYNLTCRMYVDSILPIPAPGVAAVETKAAEFYNTSSSASGAILSIKAIDNNNFRLRLSYRDMTTSVCNGSTADGTVCTPVADEDCSGLDRATICPENNHCESACQPRTFAATIQPLRTWITWTMQQENGTDAEVALRLWAGLGDYTPASYLRGGSFQTVGFCAGGANVNLACLTNSDCPASTCTTTNKVTIDRVRMGKWDTGNGTGLVYYAKCFGYAGSTAYPNQTWDTLLPISDIAQGNWTANESGDPVRSCDDTHLYDCLADPGIPDGGRSAIQNDAAAQPTAQIRYAAISTPSPAPTPLALLVEGEAQQTVIGVGSFDLEALVSGTTPTTNFTTFSMDFSDSGSSAEYHNLPLYATTDSTVLGNIMSNTLTMWFMRPSGTGSDRYRISAAPASVIRETAYPATIANIPDADGNGFRNVNFLGDSISDNDDYQLAVNDAFSLLNADSVTFCALGGTMPLDFADDITEVINGTDTQYMACRDSKRGTPGKADVMNIMGGVNAWHGALSGPPSNLAIGGTDVAAKVEGGISKDGFCEMPTGTGAQQAKPCRCPASTFQRRTNDANGAVRYCMTKGSGAGAFGASCTATSNCTCASNADCTFNNSTAKCGACVNNNVFTNGSYCTTNADCITGVCDLDKCTTGAVAAKSSLTDACAISNNFFGPIQSTWCGYGCTDSPGCVGGYCFTTPALVDVQSDFESIDTQIAAYPTPSAAPTPPLLGRPIRVYMTEPAPQDNCGSPGCYQGIKHHVEGLNRWLRSWTQQDTERRFIDVAGYLADKCPVYNKTCSDETCCYTDAVHPNAKGQRLMAEIIYNAYAHVGAVGDGTHDGTCTANVCTTGKRGYACSANADCDYYRMNFTLTR